MENLQNLKNETIKKREAIENFIIANNDYEARAATFNYGEGTIKVRHREYNWIEFLELSIDLNKDEIDFSYSSGAWNKGVSVDTKIKATLEMFNMAKNAIDNKEELFNLVEDYMKSFSVFMEAVRKNTKKQESEKIEKARQELLKTHKEVDVSEAIEKIENGEIVEVIRLGYNEIKKETYLDICHVYYIQMKRKTYRINENHVNKITAHSFIEKTPNLFVKK